MSKIIIGIILGLVIAAVIFGAYTMGKKQSVSPAPASQTLASPTPSITPDLPFAPRERPTAGFVNPSATISTIDDAFAKSDKTLGLDLGAWMANQVSVTLFATECCGFKDSKAASTQLDDFVKKGTNPWDCSDSNPAAKLVLSKDTQSFKDMIICTSANKMLIGFHLDNEFLIDKISLVNDYQQITGP